MNTTITIADAALEAARNGFHVFPLHGVRSRAEDDGRLVCTCGESDCAKPGKHGALRGKRIQDNATNDVPTVRRWWKDQPARNIAAATGRRAGILVIDVDAGGGRVLAEIEARHGPLPATLEARTGTGGRHLYFRHPAQGTFPSSESRFGVRLNAIGEDGYVVLPPSQHASGDRYEWIDPAATLADLPAWLVELWAPTPTVEIGAVATVEEDPREHVSGLDPYAVCRGVITGDDVRPALSALAGALARAEVDPDAVRQRLRDLNAQRCRPPLAKETVDDIVYAALSEDAIRRADERAARARLPKVVADGRSAADQRVLAALRDRERRERARDPARSALRAWIDTYWGVLDYDEPRSELRLVWLETGQVVEIPAIGTPADIERRVIRFVGSLDLWARRAHEQANGKLLVSLLKNLVAGAPARKREDDDSAPVQLVRVLRSMNVWIETENDRGETRRYPKSLDLVEGFFPDAGIGRIRSRGRLLLVATFPKLANGALRSHPDFRGLNERRLRDLFLAAPGSLPNPVRPREATRHGETDYWAVDLGAFDDATGVNSARANVIEIDSRNSRGDENTTDPPGETQETLREHNLPQTSRTPAAAHEIPADLREMRELCGSLAGDSPSVADALFS